MKSRSLFLHSAVITLIMLIAGLAVAQEPETVRIPKRISKGVVNSSAIKLTVPKYPAAAAAVGASGAVSVSIVISVSGDVLHAAAVSGHPLLRPASVEAALSSKFKSTLLAGQPVEVAGILVYNFLPQAKRFSALRLGFAVEYLKNTSNEWVDGLFYDLERSTPSSWVDEKANLKSVADYFHSMSMNREEGPINNPAAAAARAAKKETTPSFIISDKDVPGLAQDTNKTPASDLSTENETKVVRQTVPAGSFKIGETSSSDRIVLIQDPVVLANILDNEISLQLESFTDHHWLFKAGKTAARLVSDVDDPASFNSGIDSVRILLGAVPINMPEEIVAELQLIIAQFDKADVSAGEKRLNILEICRRLAK